MSISNPIQWISVDERVPENRRPVLAWGGVIFFTGSKPRKQFLGSTKFNPTPTGGRFDVEQDRTFSVAYVTHWAEIEGPGDV